MEMTCAIEGCGKPVECRGWCNLHYRRFRRHGDVLGGRETKEGEPIRFYREKVLQYQGDECLIWPYAKTSKGYGTLWIGQKNQRVIRLVCEEFNGPPPTPKHEAAHSCGNGHLGCVTKGHLRWATTAENQAEKIAHGTSLRGEKQWNAKLTESDVREIRSLSRFGLSEDLIAKKFKVHQATVRAVVRRKSWAWFEPDTLPISEARANRKPAAAPTEIGGAS
jgi:hypothetical protein